MSDQPLEVTGINQNFAKSGHNKELYIVTIEGQKVNDNPIIYIFVSTRLDEGSAAIKISGWDVSDIDILRDFKNVKNYNEALAVVKLFELQILTIPWNRILKIRQLKFSTDN